MKFIHFAKHGEAFLCELPTAQLVAVVVEEDKETIKKCLLDGFVPLTSEDQDLARAAMASLTSGKK